MNPHDIAALVNLLGFITGAVLYAMLLVMVLRAALPAAGQHVPERLLLATALLGLWWNLSELVVAGLGSLGVAGSLVWLRATAFTALSSLPAVVVHSVLRTSAELARRRGAQLITAAAYALSLLASLLHFSAAAAGAELPSATALQALTFGFTGLTLALVFYLRRTPIWPRALWAAALAVFAVSALHLSRHAAHDSWFVELLGHHAALPLVLAMLYQDYRFALADIFLKRALALLALVTLACGLYVFAVAPLLHLRDGHGDLDPRAIGALLGLWVGTALLYPLLRRAVIWFVDAVILRRANYQELRTELARLAAACEEPEEILDRVAARLAEALTASEVRWFNNADAVENNSASLPQARLQQPAATVLVPTAEAPRYSLVIGKLAGGRRLLSDDVALIEAVALMLARRIDAVRVLHERCASSLREQEISKLATEAELRALRAQLNPHFLFNALTTIGYLIQTAPERAFETLMRLTGLLRAVLRRSDGEFITLGEEFDLIESYLAIERARFEERLRPSIDLPPELRALRIPPLLVQPLVENAIKHGIAPRREGGEVCVAARMEADGLLVAVRDSGTGAGATAFARGRARGVGIANVEQRLQRYFGPAAALHIQSQPGAGTTVELRLPLHTQSDV